MSDIRDYDSHLHSRATTVAVLSFRLGAADGVSVAAAQWVVVPRRLGCRVHTVAGASTADRLVPGSAFDALHPAPARLATGRPQLAALAAAPRSRKECQRWLPAESSAVRSWGIDGHGLPQHVEIDVEVVMD